MLVIALYIESEIGWSLVIISLRLNAGYPSRQNGTRINCALGTGWLPGISNWRFWNGWFSVNDFLSCLYFHFRSRLVYFSSLMFTMIVLSISFVMQHYYAALLCSVIFSSVVMLKIKCEIIISCKETRWGKYKFINW